jgi:hypothetical protein
MSAFRHFDVIAGVFLALWAAIVFAREAVSHPVAIPDRNRRLANLVLHGGLMVLGVSLAIRSLSPAVHIAAACFSLACSAVGVMMRSQKPAQ